MTNNEKQMLYGDHYVKWERTVHKTREEAKEWVAQAMKRMGYKKYWIRKQPNGKYIAKARMEE